MSNFICPVCRQELLKKEKSYVCASCHSFDIAREGYVNLLPSGKANSAVPGDNKDMVKARTNFLESGGYRIFAQAIANTVAKYASKQKPFILDAGCGQGYYDRNIKDKLAYSTVCGVDISKFAVKYAASHNQDIQYAVAGVYDLPIKNDSTDIILSVFSPIAQEEFCRVAKKDSYLIIAVPGPRHLYGLKEILYQKPYQNPVIQTEYKGFEFIERIAVKSSLEISDKDLIASLFAMTPYYWKTDVEGHQRLAQAVQLVTETEFDILVYKKI